MNSVYSLLVVSAIVLIVSISACSKKEELSARDESEKSNKEELSVRDESEKKNYLFAMRVRNLTLNSH